MFTKYALEWLTETAILDSVNNFVSTYRFARYFKKGIAIKHMLIYSKYFGFADHLWRHGARYGLCKLSHRVSHINEPHPPPLFLFIPICLNAMTDLCINKCTSGKWPPRFFRDYKLCNFRHFLPSVALWFLYSSFRLNLVFLYNNKEVFLRNVFTTKCSFK